MLTIDRTFVHFSSVQFPNIKGAIPTPQNCLITDLRARGLSKYPLVTIYSLLTISLINLGFYFSMWVVDCVPPCLTEMRPP